MKHTVITFFLLIIVCCGFAQDKDKRELIKALKIAFITEKLELTSSEAQKFWPIYNAYELEREMLRKNMREKKNNLTVENLTESEAKIVLSDMVAFEEERTKQKTDFVERLLTALPAKKIILLKVADDEFNKRMLEEFKRRRGR